MINLDELRKQPESVQQILLKLIPITYFLAGLILGLLMGLIAL